MNTVFSAQTRFAPNVMLGMLSVAETVSYAVICTVIVIRAFLLNARNAQILIIGR
jgi:hypothetical protein